VTDLLIRGGTVITADGPREADVAIENGVIAAVGPGLGRARDEIDARGLTLLPGVVDVHLHFNEPGRAHWEGGATGSRAFAAGGGTLFFDMPLNSTPCTVTAGDVELKRLALESASITDFGLWGGLTPGSVGSMDGMAAAGVVGFKAFMSNSGLPEFPRADDATLFEGMREASRLGLPVAVHAENEEMTAGLARRTTGRGVRDFLRSRPVVAELEAIQRALLFAEETAAPLHIVHISSGRGVAMAAAAKARGVDVSIETCAHYLFFTEEDVERLGAAAKCAPPLRPGDERDRLWRELLAGHVDIVASDHSPAEPRLKQGDFMAAWGGIAGVQSTLAVLLDRGHRRRDLPLERVAALLASTPARRFKIDGKGQIAPGFDADVVLLDLDESFTLDASELHQRHKSSPYVGQTFRGRVKRTIRRGETIFADGRIYGETKGRFVRPAATDGRGGRGGRGDD
jgi:allantoinase